MKRCIRVSFFGLLTLFALPFSSGSAAPVKTPAADIDQHFAPGSVVRFEHLSIEDGLSQNAGLDLFQDSRGYLWIGTQDGLNRYDGYSFKIYKHDPDNPLSLSHNSILEIAEDASGALWIGTWGGGLNRYNPVSETFTRYRHDESNPMSASGSCSRTPGSALPWLGWTAVHWRRTRP